MAEALNPTNVREILAVGMNAAASSTNGGATWRPITRPPGTRAASYDQTGRILYAGVLDGQRAHTYRSTDNGAILRWGAGDLARSRPGGG